MTSQLHIKRLFAAGFALLFALCMVPGMSVFAAARRGRSKGRKSSRGKRAVSVDQRDLSEKSVTTRFSQSRSLSRGRHKNPLKTEKPVGAMLQVVLEEEPVRGEESLRKKKRTFTKVRGKLVQRLKTLAQCVPDKKTIKTAVEILHAIAPITAMTTSGNADTVLVNFQKQLREFKPKTKKWENRKFVEAERALTTQELQRIRKYQELITADEELQKALNSLRKFQEVACKTKEEATEKLQAEEAARQDKLQVEKDARKKKVEDAKTVAEMMGLTSKIGQQAKDTENLADATRKLADNKIKIDESEGELAGKKAAAFQKKLITAAVCIVGVAGFSIAGVLLYKWAVRQFGRPAVLDQIKISECRDFSEMIIPKKLKGQIEGTVEEITKHGEMYNILLHGPPGTGKSFFGKGMAKRMHTVDRSVEFFFTSGARFTQMPVPDAVKAFTELLDYVRRRARNGKRLIVFIDEADRVFTARYGANATALTRALTEAFLAAVPAPSNDGYMFIMATNHPEQLDSAVFDRTSGHQFEVGLPGQTEREQLMSMYLNKSASKRDLAIPAGFDQYFPVLAKTANGFSARGIEEVCSGIARRALRSGGITIEIARDVVEKQARANSEQKKRSKKQRDEKNNFTTNVEVVVNQPEPEKNKGFFSRLFGW